MMQYNNHQIVGVCGFDNDRAEAWPGWSIWEGTAALFWPSNEQPKIKQKNGKTFDGRRSLTPHTTTNQKHVGAMERVYKRSYDQGGAHRGDNTIVLGGIRS
jgi:hypothetical protein